MPMLPTIDPAVICQPVTDGAVLFHTRSEVYFGLNAAGHIVWQQLESGGTTVGSICEALLATFPDADPAVVRGDVEALIDELLGHGLLRGAEAD